MVERENVLVQFSGKNIPQMDTTATAETLEHSSIIHGVTRYKAINSRITGLISPNSAFIFYF
jgi:hypothetical protein